jgi:hypothetical protein
MKDADKYMAMTRDEGLIDLIERIDKLEKQVLRLSKLVDSKYLFGGKPGPIIEHA